ncbi:HET-domain-containing protein, partial [Aspergillus ellipticus CBS 707.79]
MHPHDEGHEFRYATTLSHCWGSPKLSHTSRLTSDSVEPLTTGIDISSLDHVARDAVSTARLLGLSLLWVDSLCIFQDSHDDWLHEAPLMSYIYGGAVINIAASVAAHRDRSCFPPRDDTLSLQMPLMSRAWVVQELLLAPRLLHLCGSQLFWECSELNACETFPDGLPPNNPARACSAEKKIRVERRHGKLWTRIVAQYTQSNLTFPTDKLVAISGVARIIEHALDDNYCAGLWRKSLVTDLSW